jgi:uncharacterized protein YjeT (DUF2065 family)
MSSSRMRKDKENRLLKLVGICLVALGLGYYMLFHVSRMLKPPLGNTFYILMGCVFIAVSCLVLLVSLKHHFFPKRRKKRSNVVFLEDELKKNKKSE